MQARPALAGDLPGLGDLYAAIVADLAARRGGHELAPCLLGGEDVRARFARAHRSDDACLLVGVLDGRLVGVAAGSVPPSDAGGWSPSPGARTALVDLLYVHARARRQGVGSELLGALTRWAAGRGATALDAPALPGDRALKSLFEAHGLRARLLVLHATLLGPDP